MLPTQRPVMVERSTVVNNHTWTPDHGERCVDVFSSAISSDFIAMANQVKMFLI
jgi:hypothetical protein